MQIILRKDNESILDYQIRICTNKEIYDLSWQDVSDNINRESDSSYHKDKYRKWFEVYSELDGHFQDKYAKSDDELMQELEEKQQEIKKERIRLSDQRTGINKILRDEARREQALDMLLEEIQNLSNNKPLLSPLIIDPVKKYDKHYREGAALLSDWHTGIFINNYWNSFDDNELFRRVGRYIKKSIECSLKYNVQRLHFFGLGDFINGLIHVTARINSSHDSVSQTMIVCELLAEMLASYYYVFDEILLYFVRGNHDRVNPHKDEEVASESFADFIPFYLKWRLANYSDKIKFVDNVYDDEIAHAEICGEKILATHGHRDNLNNIAQNLTMMTGIKPDQIYMGHIHRNASEEVHMVRIIVNPCLSGVDAYAKEIRKTSIPAQKFLVYEDGEGIFTEKSIRLDLK